MTLALTAVTSFIAGAIATFAALAWAGRRKKPKVAMPDPGAFSHYLEQLEDKEPPANVVQVNYAGDAPIRALDVRDAHIRQRGW